MARVTCFAIAGMKLWFFSNDHEPPHFHAKRKGAWEVRVFFQRPPGDMFELVWAAKKKEMSRQDRQFLEEAVETHRFVLLREWEEKVNRT